MTTPACVRVVRRFSGQSSIDSHDATLRVDGRRRGVVVAQGDTTVDVAPGRHTVRLSLRGNWFTTTAEVDVLAGQTTVVVFERTVASARGLLRPSAYWTARVDDHIENDSGKAHP